MAFIFVPSDYIHNPINGIEGLNILLRKKTYKSIVMQLRTNDKIASTLLIKKPNSSKAIAAKVKSLINR